MRMKRVLAYIMALCLMLAATSVTALAAEVDIMLISAKPVTRGEAAMALYELEGEPAFMNANLFSDVAPGCACEKAVVWASGKGVVNGYGGGKFGPDDPVTNEQFVTMLFRYARYKEYDVSVGENTNILSYEDAFDVSGYAISAFQWACGSGVYEAVEADGTQWLKYGDALKRAGMDAMLERFAEAAAPEAPLTGGWTVNDCFGEADIPEAAQAAFNQAMDGLVGAAYTPVAYLGSQVVAGVNYAFLCRCTLVTAEPINKLCVVRVYRDLQGGARILGVTDVKLTDYVSDSDVAFSPALAGGWKVNTESGAVLEENVQAAFDRAVSGLLGVSYRPLACLGSQVVAGANYALLCSATVVSDEPASALAVVVVYAAADGSAEVTSVAGFPIA